MRPHRQLALGLFLLAVVVSSTAILGPLVTGVLRYRTSPTTLNQLMGGDAAALAVVVPWCVAAGVLAWRAHPAAPVLALAPGCFAVYTYTQLIVGQEYLRLPGNNERFFPLLYAGFLLGALIAVAAWRSVEAVRLPALSRPMEKVAAGVLVAVAAFLLLQHLPSYLDAMRDQPTRVEYLSSPTPFWLVKLMDLGIVAPAALATAIGLARNRGWARTPTYAILGAYTLLGASVAGMAITMLANHDPDAAIPVAAGFTLFTLAFATLTTLLYRPLLRTAPTAPHRDPSATVGATRIR